MIREDQLCQWHKARLEREREDREIRRNGGGGFPASMTGGGSKGARQCGYRKEGGTYATVPHAPGGMPLEYFMVCTPVKIDAEEYRLNPKGVGVNLIDVPETCQTCGGGGKTMITERGEALVDDEIREAHTILDCSRCGGLGLETVTHVFDIVGAENYPNVADFLEEARRMGVSRRLELEGEDQYARLTRRSRLILLHRRAVIENPLEYWGYMTKGERAQYLDKGCPLHRPLHCSPATLDDQRGHCAGLYWHDIEPGDSKPEPNEVGVTVSQGIGFTKDARVMVQTPIELSPARPADRRVRRTLASGSYIAYERAPEILPRYALGIFAIFPLAKIEVIDPAGKFKEKVKRARASKVDVSIEEC
jgi:hypothetical protein